MKKIKTSYDTPLYNALVNYCGKGAIPFHMPGHKQGRGLPKSFFDALAQIDLTELPGLDNLHWPEGAVKKAQEYAAEVFRAEHSYFLVNGSSSGLLAATMAICSPGKKVLVQRDCHISVVNGLMLAGAEPVFPKNEINSDFGITDALETREIKKALEKHPDIAGVILTRPSYYGVCSDLQEIVKMCHQYGKPVAVDEAHGAHLGFADFLPPSATDCGADISVQSAHKTLPSLTQSAYLHLRGDLIDKQKLEFYLRVFQSTSPSYLLMASLDICRAIMQQEGAHLLHSLRRNILELLSDIAGKKNLVVLGLHETQTLKYDLTRIVINFRNLGLDGFTAQSLLLNECGIQAEMSDLNNVVLISGVSDKKEDFVRLSAALNHIYQKCNNSVKTSNSYNSNIMPESIPTLMPDIPERAVPLQDTQWQNQSSIPLEIADGRVSAGMLTPYPPGIPVVWPGEVITSDAVAYLKAVREAGGNVNGLSQDLYVQVVA